jgi:HNH endonuclease
MSKSATWQARENRSGGRRRLRHYRCLYCRKWFDVERGKIARSRKHCSQFCERIHKRELSITKALNRAKRPDRLKPNRYGSDWPTAQSLCRARDANRCVRCDTSGSKTRGLPVDHIVPFRLASEWHPGGGNSQVNLWCLCLECHGRKLVADTLAKKGDGLAWTRGMLAFCGDDPDMFERFCAAMRHFGLQGLVEKVSGWAPPPVSC